MITTIQYKYGFEYKKVRYVWKNKNLFRLPYINDNNKSYKFMAVPKYCFKTAIVYNIQRNKITINKLQKMTKKVNWSQGFINDKDCPF